MKELRNIIDTWKMIEKFGVKNFEKTDRDTVKISNSDFQKILDGSANKRYVKNLLTDNGRLCCHGYI